nr:hypothetical protein [Tanacetum cinerariifolium]
MNSIRGGDGGSRGVDVEGMVWCGSWCGGRRLAEKMSPERREAPEKFTG